MAAIACNCSNPLPSLLQASGRRRLLAGGTSRYASTAEGDAPSGSGGDIAEALAADIKRCLGPDQAGCTSSALKGATQVIACHPCPLFIRTHVPAAVLLLLDTNF